MERILRIPPLAVAAFCVAAVYVPGLFSATHMPRWWAMALLLPLVSDLDPRRLPAGVTFCLFGGLAWAAASLAWSPIPAEGFGDLIGLVLLSLALIAASGVDEFDDVVAAFGYGIAISSVLCVMQWYGYGFAVNIPRNGPAGLFLSTEVLAETAAPVLVWAVLKRRPLLVAAMLAPLAVCNSRIAVIAALVGVLFGWRPRWSWLKPALVMVLIAAAIASIGVLGMDKAGSGLTRFVLWGAGIMSLSWSGGGLGYWAVAFLGPFEEYAHSDPLQLLVELGAGALLLIAVPVIVWFRGVGDVAERSAFGCLAVESLVSFPLHTPAAAFLAAILAGCMAGRWRRLCRGELLGRDDADPDLRRSYAPGAAMVRDIAAKPAHVPVR